jgi:hypothetical protein
MSIFNWKELSLNGMKVLLMLIILVPLCIVACATPPEETAVSSLARLEPASGTYYGVHLNLDEDTPAAYNQRLGMPAAVYVAFFPFPFNDTNLDNLDDFIEQVSAEEGIALITLQPESGLDKITATVAYDLADLLEEYNQSGVPVFVRFGHEMNGSWYSWSQQPTAYVRAFRTLAEAVHQRTTLSAMLWAPNYGGGYPFAGGRYEASPQDSDFHLLDTNQDGYLDMGDDMYAPYYPGDDAVDWVGMSVYHWGNQHPWGENEIPEAGKFIALITGTYLGLDGDHRPVPDFYQTYVEQHGKPMAVPETAALYNPDLGGDTELSIKQAWWRQVFSAEVAEDVPGIKMINWFEAHKYESEVGTTLDWTVTSNPELLQAYLDDLPRSRLLFANDLPDFTPEGNQRGTE